MSEFSSYYLNELNALHLLGKEFAQENPALAPYLDGKTFDPDIERLFEGFAFLTGRLNQRLDDELPELTHTLMRLLWSNYAQTTPAFSTVKFTPEELLLKPLLIKRGTPMLSMPVDNVQCNFQTSYDVTVLPLAVNFSKYESSGQSSHYTIKLDLLKGALLNSIITDSLRFHLHGEDRALLQLQLMLMEHCVEISCYLKSEGNICHHFSLNSSMLSPVGFSKNEMLIDFSVNVPHGFRYLQEYFCYPEKFHYFDLNGLSGLSSLQDDLNIEHVDSIEFVFNIKNFDNKSFYPDRVNVDLFCTPVTNVFETDVLPVVIDQKKDNYHLHPENLNKSHGVIIKVDSMYGWDMGSQENLDFEDYLLTVDKDVEVNSYAIHQSINSATGLVDTTLSLPTLVSKHNTLVVSGTVKACNANLPSKLAVGDINYSSDIPNSLVSFYNISVPTKSCNPPLNGNGIWDIITNISKNFLELDNIDSWKSIIKSLDFPGMQYNNAAKKTQRLLLGMTELTTKQTNRIYQGYPLRGFQSYLELESKNYSSEGEAYLFASILNQLTHDFCNVNSFNQLIVSTSQGSTYTWPMKIN